MYSVVDLQELARSHGGECLSNAYSGMREYHRFRCSVGHNFIATPATVLQAGGWCYVCHGGRGPNVTIELARAYGRARRATCLSDVCSGSKAKLPWRCDLCAMEFVLTPTGMKRGQRPACPRCNRGNIDDMHRLAGARGARCLSTTYVSSKDALRWQCLSCAHRWSVAPTSLQQGHACPQCRAPRRT